jgi:steroid delta-isomerase-like uncharacterized protein
MASASAIRKLIVEHVEAENARNPERVMATYGDDCVFEDVPRGRRHVGRTAILANYRELWLGFPSMVRRIDRMTIEGDGCVCELTLSGRHEGPYRGVPPSGRDGTVRICCHFAIAPDGRIRQETAYYDSQTLVEQLGLMPALDSVPGRLLLAVLNPLLLPRMLLARVWPR